MELTAGATPIDFAYAIHTDLGHRCRGAKVDGAMVPLNTPLRSGQTVEVTAAKVGGPSLDWLNPDLGYLQSQRSRAKVRAWFNAQAQSVTVARGREAVEKLLQREGRTALKLEDLAAQLGFRSADALFEVVGKDEFSLRNIENLLRPAESPPAADEQIALRRSRPSSAGRSGVLVVGVDSLLTSLARCCRPAPPDAVAGFVTKGRGVAVHRVGCSNFRQMAEHAPERVIEVAVGCARRDAGPLSGRRQRRGTGPARPAARHLGGFREGEDERDRGVDTVAQGRHGAIGPHDVHGRGHRHRPARGRPGNGRPHRRCALCPSPLTAGTFRRRADARGDLIGFGADILEGLTQARSSAG